MKNRIARKTGGVVVKDKAPTEIYAGKGSNVAKEAVDKSEGFKKGGKAVKMDGEKSKASAARMPRKSGGKVMSTAASGTPRSKSSHY